MSDLHRDIGSLEARMDSVERRLEKIEGRLDQLVLLAEQAKGGWRTLIAVGSVAASIGAGLASIVAWVKGWL